MCSKKICGRGSKKQDKEKEAEQQRKNWIWMEGSIEEVLTVPIQLTERVREAVEEADSFRQECAEVAKQVERLAIMLRTAARVASTGLYERPMRRIVQEVVKSLEKALALVRKCKRSGILKRVITITSGTDFKRMSSQLESSIGDVNWLLNVWSGSGAGGGSMLSLPPIASTDPIIAWVWGFIANVHNGTLEDKEEAANNLASLAADNDRNGKIIIEEGGVPPLLRLLKEGGSVSAQLAAAIALCNLSTNQERVGQIVDEGAIAVVLGSLSDSPARVQAKVASALSRMVFYDPHAKEVFGQHNVIRPLVSLLAADMDDPAGRVDRNHLSIHSVVQLGIHRRTGSNLMAENHRGAQRREREEDDLAAKLELKTEVARALWRLAENSDTNSKRITDTKGLLCLAKLIQREEGFLQENCLLAVMEIAAAAERNPDLRRAAFKTNSPAAKAVVEQLLCVANDESKSNLQIPALKAIGCLAHTFPVREIRILKPLIKQLSHKEPAVAAEAATALHKFVHADNYLHKDYSKAIIEFGGVAPLVRMMKLDDKDAQVAALILLCYLALRVGNSEALEHAKALAALEFASRTPISQLPSVRELLPQAIKHLELYQAGGHLHTETYNDHYP